MNAILVFNFGATTLNSHNKSHFWHQICNNLKSHCCHNTETGFVKWAWAIIIKILRKGHTLNLHNYLDKYLLQFKCFLFLFFQGQIYSAGIPQRCDTCTYRNIKEITIVVYVPFKYYFFSLINSSRQVNLFSLSSHLRTC